MDYKKNHTLERVLFLNLFGNFSFRTGYLEMRCSKSCYLRDLELVDLFANGVIEQVFCIQGSLAPLFFVMPALNGFYQAVFRKRHFLNAYIDESGGVFFLHKGLCGNMAVYRLHGNDFLPQAGHSVP